MIVLVLEVSVVGCAAQYCGSCSPRSTGTTLAEALRPMARGMRLCRCEFANELTDNWSTTGAARAFAVNV
mgnify:FL=1